MPNLVNDFEVRKETLRALGGNPDGLANIYEVDLEILKLIGSGEQGIPDAPIDGVQYARQNGEWTPVESGLDWNTIKQKLAEDGVESIKFNIQVPINTKKYIGFDDGAFAFRTGHTITTNTRVQMKFRCLKGTDNAFIGMRMYNASDNRNKWRFVCLGGNNAFQQICDYNGEHRCTLLNINPDNWYELELGNCYIKDVQTGEILAQNTDTVSGSWGELVFNACRGEKGDIAYVKVFEGDELVRDYIAAADENGNNGFYESLSNTFTIADGWQRSENNDWTDTHYVHGEVILTGDEVKTLLTQQVIPDAPSDGKQYARQDGAWTSVKEGLNDAPSDGTQYARQDGAWVPVQTTTEGKYITITADESNTGETIIHPNIEGSLPNLNLQYRINNGKWNDFIVGTTADIKIGAGDVLQFKGDNKEGVSKNGNYLNFAISENPVHLSGNIMSLIDGVGDALEIPNDYCFYALFRNSAIKTVSSDFLPATTLKSSCYRDLFSGCQNLTQAPDLPATTIMDGCYNGMFYNCSLLTTAPELPAKVLVDGCYGYMFTYCNSLNYVKCLSTEGTINGDGTVPSALDNWLNGVASTGTIEKISGVSYEAGGNGIPEGWTVKEIYEYVEAPMDGNQYARQNGEWTVVESGISDAPFDGKTYGRNNGAWTPVESGGSVIPEGKYMTITVDESNSGETIISPTVTGTLSPNLQYRINNGSWTDFVVGTTADIHVVAGDFVQFKGNNPSGISAYNNYLNFAISGLCHLSGNVMSLIDGVGETLVIPNDYCFYRLFFNSNVKTVSKDFLPAITLTNSCYDKMFRECQNLTNAPELPATTLSSGCYNELFIGCTNLTQAPELPATTLEYNCYHGMFQGCSNLVKAPEILPATTLAEHCYESMFSGCINLTNAPVLPAKTLVDSCYYFMFDNCRKLNGVKSLAVEGLNNSSALGSWLNSVASSGTFEKPYGVVYPTGSIPTGWTVKNVDLYIEAPMDGNQYTRQNGAWVEVSKVKTTNNTTMQFWSGTQQEYDAIATKDSHTLYIIK